MGQYYEIRLVIHKPHEHQDELIDRIVAEVPELRDVTGYKQIYEAGFAGSFYYGELLTNICEDFSRSYPDAEFSLSIDVPEHGGIEEVVEYGHNKDLRYLFTELEIAKQAIDQLARFSDTSELISFTDFCSIYLYNKLRSVTELLND